MNLLEELDKVNYKIYSWSIDDQLVKSVGGYIKDDKVYLPVSINSTSFLSYPLSYSKDIVGVDYHSSCLKQIERLKNGTAVKNTNETTGKKSKLDKYLPSSYINSPSGSKSIEYVTETMNDTALDRLLKFLFGM